MLSQVGLDVGGESIPYIAGWGESGALDAIRQHAETIDQLARRIEDEFTPPAHRDRVTLAPRRVRARRHEAQPCSSPTAGLANPHPAYGIYPCSAYTRRVAPIVSLAVAVALGIGLAVASARWPES